MNEVAEYLKSCGTFYLATSEEGQAHVRPFGAVRVFEGKLYIVTNNQKKVYQQMKKNGKVEICGMHKGTWIRVEGEVKEDLRREARAAMMEENKAALSSMYTIDDNLMTVFGSSANIRFLILKYSSKQSNICLENVMLREGSKIGVYFKIRYAFILFGRDFLYQRL